MGIAAEDWNRTLNLLKFYNRHKSDVKKDSGFLHWDQTRHKPKEVEYFRPEDIEGLDRKKTAEAEGDLGGRTLGDILAEIYGEVADREDPELQKFEETIPYAQFVEGQASEWETVVDETEKTIRRKEKVLGSSGRTVKRAPITLTRRSSLLSSIRLSHSTHLGGILHNTVGMFHMPWTS